ncbi:protein kinase domain-containing protein (plasmid) [Legionella sp. D16C41]|uniref:protein kinase domain-containing protein n=1 Tax=Legionella sp. D16C41 TaxID=3402688 RepID=UPI003AF5B351
MQTRRTKNAEQEFTTITTDQGSYELWNSLTAEQENLVIEQLGLEKGGLPLSQKDAQRQRLLFGQGAFGKVRLAQKDGKFLAVKKLAVKSETEKTALLKEYDFGRMLKAANIPHVAYGTDSVISTDARGQERLYLFMDSVAALGDGNNFKKLISYLPSDEKRTAVLKHAARSLLEATAKMQEHQLYHRDIKASNLLVSASGEIYLSDFGSAGTSNSNLIATVLKQNITHYDVSHMSDRRYFTPEIHTAITLNQSLPTTSIEIDALHDNWRLGLTLLQLCGVLKEGQGLLSLPYTSHDEFGNEVKGWIEELKQIKSNKPFATLINERFRMELEKIKAHSLHKVPAELQSIIFGLLEIDPEKRLTAAEALTFLSSASEAEKQDVAEGFKTIVHNQIAVAVKNKIKKALKNAAKESSNGNQWLNIALEDFKILVEQPYTTPQNIQNFIDYWIRDEKNRPNLTFDHYETLLNRVHKKLNRLQETASTIGASNSLPEVMESNILEEETVNFQESSEALHSSFMDVADSHYGPMQPPRDVADNHYSPMQPPLEKNNNTGHYGKFYDVRAINEVSEVSSLVDIESADSPYSPMQLPLDKNDNTGHYGKSYNEENDIAHERDHYDNLEKANRLAKALKPAYLKSNETQYGPIQVQAGEAAEIARVLPENTELNRLENAFTQATNDLMDYCQSNVNAKARSEINTIINSMKKGLKHIKALLSSKPVNSTQVEKIITGPIDETALQAVVDRTELIVIQLSLGKIMQLDEKSITAVSQMLTKDKQFLESIATKTNKRDKIDELVNKIDQKLELLKKTQHSDYLSISTNPLDDLAYLKKETEKTVYIANNNETKTEFKFTKFKHITSYELPKKLTDDVINFIANRTIKELNNGQNIYIYTSNKKIGKAIAQTMLQLDANNRALKIYVNDQLITLKKQQSRGKLFGFFGEKAKPSFAKQDVKFTVKEINEQSELLRH